MRSLTLRRRSRWWDAKMEEVEPWEEEEEWAEADPMPEQAVFGMEDTLVGFEVAKHRRRRGHPSFQYEAEVEANLPLPP